MNLLVKKCDYCTNRRTIPAGFPHKCSEEYMDVLYCTELEETISDTAYAKGCDDYNPVYNEG